MYNYDETNFIFTNILNPIIVIESSQIWREIQLYLLYFYNVYV